MNLKDIAIKILHGELPALAEGELSAERMKVCVQCPEYMKLTRQCRVCGCFLDLKTKVLEMDCPEGKW